MNVLKNSVGLFAHSVRQIVSLNNMHIPFRNFVYFSHQVINQKSCLLDVNRNYSKSKDKGKDKKKSTAKVDINPTEISKYIDINNVKAEYDQMLENMKEEFAKNITIRSSVGSIETLSIPFEGKNYELQEVAQIVRKNPKTVILNMASIPQIIPTVMKSIQSSGLNLNPQQDGTTVFIPVPKVTKEHRESLAKNAKALFNNQKYELKQVELKCFRKLKMIESTVSTDVMFSIKKQLTALGESYIEKLKDVYLAKLKEVSNP